MADGRRQLHFQSLEEILSEVERLAARRVRTVGRWTFAQIVQHLADTMRCSLDGFGFQATWVARFLIAPLIKNSLLTKPMKPGFRLPSRAQSLLPSADVSLEAARANLREALARYEFEQPTAAHPFLGRLAAQEWVSLQLRHAELHLSFVIPEGLG